jgi:large subunit ribosomal protein L19
MARATPQNKIPDFRAGDTVTVHYKIIEGDKIRTQPFTGIVISKRGEGVSETFMVRRIGADGIGVERIFPLASPNIEKLVVERTGKVRRAKLYYLRQKVGRQATKVKERFGDIIVPPVVAEVIEENAQDVESTTEPSKDA